MAPSGIESRLFDIVEAIEIARDEIANVTLDAFEADRRRRLLVERAIEIISEASRRLPDELKARHPDIPWPRIAAIGNVIRHDYRRVAADILWNVIYGHLPNMERVCREELARVRDGGE